MTQEANRPPLECQVWLEGEVLAPLILDERLDD
jgi:hypothetical protein